MSTWVAMIKCWIRSLSAIRQVLMSQLSSEPGQQNVFNTQRSKGRSKVKIMQGCKRQEFRGGGLPAPEATGGPCLIPSERSVHPPPSKYLKSQHQFQRPLPGKKLEWFGSEGFRTVRNTSCFLLPNVWQPDKAEIQTLEKVCVEDLPRGKSTASPRAGWTGR